MHRRRACAIAPRGARKQRVIENSSPLIARPSVKPAQPLLKKERAGRVFIGEHELALGMTRHVLDSLAPAVAARQATAETGTVSS